MQVLSKEEGVFELTLLNAELSRDQFDDFVIMGVTRGIPVEIMTRLQGLWSLTKELAGEVVAIGKIVVRKIFEFLKANPNLSIGIALGAAVGALISGIPFLGPLLAPLAAGLSMLYGAAVGATLDQGIQSSDPFIAATLLARKFFELIQSIFLSIKEYFAAP